MRQRLSVYALAVNHGRGNEVVFAITLYSGPRRIPGGPRPLDGPRGNSMSSPRRASAYGRSLASRNYPPNFVLSRQHTERRRKTYTAWRIPSLAASAQHIESPSAPVRRLSPHIKRAPSNRSSFGFCGCVIALGRATYVDTLRSLGVCDLDPRPLSTMVPTT